MKICSDKGRLLAAWIILCAGLLPNSAQAAEGEASIRGVLYISYTDDPSYDVMFGSNVQVLLLPRGKGVEKEVDGLKAKRLPEIRNQQAIAHKAYLAVQRISGKDRPKLKEMRETLERESARLTRLRSDYEKDFVATLEKTAIQRTKTDGEGKFSFKQLAPGVYLLYARYEISGTANRFLWLHPAEAKEKEESEVHLNKNASFALYEEK